MFLFSSTAAAIQLIKIAVFFMTLGLPAAHDGRTAEIYGSLPTAALHEIDRPHSTPRRNDR